MVTSKEIREKYPNPTNKFSEPGGYCVGGALCEFVDERNCEKFPSYGVISDSIQKANSGMSDWMFKDKALFHARRIVAFNDRGDFEAAWRELDIALAAKPSASVVSA